MAMVMGALLGTFVPATTQEDMARGFAHPPNAAKPRVYWMWVMSLVNQAGITKDLEEMAAKGIGGVMIFDLSGSPGPMPQGPAFMSPGWRENFKHALREADRLGLEVSVNLCSGWDAGGPWITPDRASKHFQQSELKVTGPGRFSGKLPKPVGDTPSYRELAIGVGTRPAGPLSAEQENYREIAVQAVPRKPVPGQPRVQITASEEVSDRFLYDFRKAIGDCLAENHYGRLAELEHARGSGFTARLGGRVIRGCRPWMR